MCRTIYLIGIGMGKSNSLTEEAKEIIESCGCVIGAKRMTEAAGHLGKPVYTAHKPEEILNIITEHREYLKTAVLLSGDPGFYSGAKKLTVLLKEKTEGLRINTIPGISSVVCLAARLSVPWDDAVLVSVHGRNQNYIHAIAHNEKTFLLLGGGKSGREFCEKLTYYGLTDVEVSIGKNLSYEEEEIIQKTGRELKPEDFSGLDVAYIHNQSPCPLVFRSIKDEEFVRGNVPMTKEEIRTLGLAKLQLEKDSLLYDIGAGTGSVAVQAACQSGDIRVYAVEKNPKGAALIRENQKKFRCDFIEVVEGTAPEALRELPAPTHVFIGGSSGNLEEILRAVGKKNNRARIVLTAISLETVEEIMKAVRDGLLREPEIMQITSARAKEAGSYHMMCGMNPVYIIAGTAGEGKL